MTILYVHGLSSSGSGRTVESLRQLLSSDTIVSPDLPLDPFSALSLLKECVKENNVDLVIGTSMGGMFAQKLFGLPKILVNPAFHVFEFMRERLGIHEFFNPRKDGVQQFEITTSLCDQYEQIEKGQFMQVDDIEKKN